MAKQTTTNNINYRNVCTDRFEAMTIGTVNFFAAPIEIAIYVADGVWHLELETMCVTDDGDEVLRPLHYGTHKSAAGAKSAASQLVKKNLKCCY